MKFNFEKTIFFKIKSSLNLLAIAILLFNILNPHLASAQSWVFSDNFEPTLRTEPGSRLVRPLTKPKVVRGIITAYTSTEDQTDGNPFITASGKKVNEYTIAANGLPFGTVIKIPSIFGDKRFVVTDRMNSRYKFGRFDVWLKASREEAIKFGVKRAQVEIYLPDRELAVK